MIINVPIPLPYQRQITCADLNLSDLIDQGVDSEDEQSVSAALRLSNVLVQWDEKTMDYGIYWRAFGHEMRARVQPGGTDDALVMRRWVLNEQGAWTPVRSNWVINAEHTFTPPAPKRPSEAYTAVALAYQYGHFDKILESIVNAIERQVPPTPALKTFDDLLDAATEMTLALQRAGGGSKSIDLVRMDLVKQPMHHLVLLLPSAYQQAYTHLLPGLQ